MSGFKAIEWVESKGPSGLVDSLTLYFGLTSMALVTLSYRGPDGRLYRGRGGDSPAWRGEVRGVRVEMPATEDHEADLERVKREVLKLAGRPPRTCGRALLASLYTAGACDPTRTLTG